MYLKLRKKLYMQITELSMNRYSQKVSGTISEVDKSTDECKCVDEQRSREHESRNKSTERLRCYKIYNGDTNESAGRLDRNLAGNIRNAKGIVWMNEVSRSRRGASQASRGPGSTPTFRPSFFPMVRVTIAHTRYRGQKSHSVPVFGLAVSASFV